MRRPGRQLRFSDASAWYIPRPMRLPSCVILVTAASLAGTASGASRPDELWIDPLERTALRFSAADEHDRPYSVPARPRDLAGFIALSCEYQEGRPCGDGVGTALEIDSEAGWSSFLTAATRLRASAGTDRYASQLILDRAYLRFEAGPFLLQIGRDALTLGPAVRAGLIVSRNAAPQDGIRAQLKPVALPFAPDIRISLLYFLDRLSDRSASTAPCSTAPARSSIFGTASSSAARACSRSGVTAPRTTAASLDSSSSTSAA